MALITHSNKDCGFFITDSQCVITNKAGGVGAYVADILLAFFGYLAFLIPIALVLVGLVLFRPVVKKNTSNVSGGGINAWLSVTGVFMALFAGSGLATLLWPDVDLIYRGGGLLGIGVVKIIHSEFGDYGSALLLLSLFFAGITLLADIKWGVIVEFIGKYALKAFDYVLTIGEKSVDSATTVAERKTGTSTTGKLAGGMALGSLGAVISHRLGRAKYWMQQKFARILPSAEPFTPSYADSPDPLTESVLNIPREMDFRHPQTMQRESLRNQAVTQEERSSESSYQTIPAHMQQELKPPKEEMSLPPEGLPSSKADSFEGYNMPEFQEHTRTAYEDLPPETVSPIAMQGTPPATPPVASDVTSEPVVNNNEEFKARPQAIASAYLDDGSAPAPAPSDNLGKIKSFFGMGSQALGSDVLPKLSLLSPPPTNQHRYSSEYLESVASNLVEALGHYGIKDAEVIRYSPGPVITRYEVQLKPGTKVSKIASVVKDLARTLGMPSVRLVEVIPGTTNIGIELPNDIRNMVTIGSVLESKEFRNKKSSLTMVLGVDIEGTPVTADLAKMPHVLVAGTTGSGKSVGVNAMLISILFKATPQDVKLILIDPKMLELSIYEDIPHLLTPVVTDMKDAANSLRWCVAEMERRYLLMSKLKVRNVAGFNEKIRKAIEKGDPIIDPLYDPTTSLNVTPEALEPLPFIVVVIDEFADMMMVVGKKVEELIARLAQKARAAGIHLILATQRPSVDVITGLIKANIPTRIAFQVASSTDSRTILDQMGAEQLLGKGDMLYMPPGSGLPQRVHGAFVDDHEVDAVVTYVKEHQGEPDYLDDVLQEPVGDAAAIPGLEPIKESSSERDALYDEAIVIVTESRRASISYLQRRLKVGYNRAATIIEDMEAAGVVSEVQTNGSREVLAPPPVTD